VVQGAEDGSDPVIKMVPRVPLRGPRKARTSVFNFDIMNRSLQVPTSKPENLPNISDEGMKEKLEELRNLFEDRPIWSRLALHNTTSIPYPELTILLGHLAYTVHLGAFRDLWVRFGVDPRTDRTLFIYQLVFILFLNL
jgi:general transcription factor 3C polypeptide 5 (transcription factor C subunit 1)